VTAYVEERIPMLKLLTALTLAAALSASALAATAAAKGGDGEVLERGTCSARSSAKLKAKLDDGRIEAEAEVDQNLIGRRWRVTIVQNGRTVFTGVRTTRAPSGSFEVRRLLANSAGADRLSFTARALASGESCRVTLSY
jgi:hypothetical protein